MVALPSNSFFSLLSPPLFSIPFLLIKSGAITLQCPYIFSDLASGRITELIFGVILVCLLHWYQFSGTKFHGIIDTCWLLHFKIRDICFAYDVDYSLFAGFFSNKISFFFFFTILYWFCHTSTCICHGCTRVPHLEPPSHLPPHPIPLGHPSVPALSTLYPASSLDWQFVSYMILYMFHAILPNHPTLSLSHRVQKTVLYICVSFAVSYTGLLLPSF